eukprot:TRINITY_DN1176_c0_g2_i1.p1 TRINITY_DN1176_c0_g2~~TRINITY_DN1176_c0_g2_i1.p1  ORF type:complete len:513 (+),score=81.96 TRINITY_DN1176_c0_g2_i1:137-1675(+)
MNKTVPKFVSLVRDTYAEYRSELLDLVQLAGPAVLTNLCDFLVVTTNLSFIGHTGDLQLAALALANVWCFATSWTVSSIGSALDTYISQALGAGNHALMGLTLQRVLVIMGILFFPVALLWFYTADIMIHLMRLDVDLSNLAGYYARLSIPSFIPLILYRSFVRYIQGQGIMKPSVFVGIIALIINLVLNYILLFTFSFGLEGLALSMTISRIFFAVAMWWCITRTPNHHKCWKGWSKEAFDKEELKSLLKIAIPSSLTLCLEVWGFEIHQIFAALLHSDAGLGATSIAYNTLIISYLLPLGLSIGGSVIVGKFLGGGKPDLAKKAAKLLFVITIVVMLCNATILFSARHAIPYLYTSSQDVIDIAATLIAFVALVTIFDGMQGVLGGILRGAGRPSIGTVANLFGHFVVGIPTALVLAFAVKWGLKGLWTGLVLGLVAVNIILVYYVLKLDFQKAAKEAQERTHAKEIEGKALLEMVNVTESEEEETIGENESGVAEEKSEPAIIIDQEST